MTELRNKHQLILKACGLQLKKCLRKNEECVKGIKFAENSPTGEIQSEKLVTYIVDQKPILTYSNISYGEVSV
jgi:hypothetical protein